MADILPLVLVPGLTCTARLWRPQIEALWSCGPIMVADHQRDADIEATAAHILKDAPPRFALAGLSFGGYIAFEMMRQAASRIGKLALLDTSARSDTPQQTEARKSWIAMAQSGRYGEIPDLSIPRYLHRDRQSDLEMTGIVREMIEQTGPEAFVRQLRAIISRPDSRPFLSAIRCPTLVLVGDGDLATPPDVNKEIADGIAGSRFVTVPHCGHLSPLEQPDAVNAALREWLER